MELWIRSQDKKTLLKVHELFIIPSEFSDHKDDTHIVRSSDFGLGYYSKERALEVLDDIYHILLTTEKGQNISVYKMPKQ